MAQVTQIARLWHCVSPILKSLEPEILDRYEKGVLPPALATEYQTDRAVIDYMLWRALSPLIRASRTVAMGMALLSGVEAYEWATGSEAVEMERVRTSKRSRNGRRGRRRDEFETLSAEVREFVPSAGAVRAA